jgi:hypothetical protein
MKLELTQSLRSMLHDLIERLLDVSDYFIYEKKVSVSEGFLLLLAASRAIWYLIYGVSGGIINYVFPDAAWIILFTVQSALHLAAFFSPTTYSRALVSSSYALIWMFLFVLAVIAPQNSPAAPTFAVFALLSAFIAVRLFRDAHA